MNRIIKFRAWDTKEGKMIQGGNLKVWFIAFRQKKGLRTSIFSDLIFQQFTGLLDKNGKEIYEGDVVRIPNYQTTWKHGEPGFDWRIFKVICNQYLYAFENSVIYTPLSSYDNRTLEDWKIEIIGNIYENPELTTPS